MHFRDSGSLARGLLRKAPGVPSVPPPELHDIWDEGEGDGAGVEVNEPGVPGIDDQEEGMDGLPPYHTYYQFIRSEPAPIPVPEMEFEGEESDERAEEENEDKSDSEEEHSGEEMDEEESEDGHKEIESPAAAKIEATPIHKPTSLQQRMLAMAGQDVDTFMKEVSRNHVVFCTLI